MRLERREGISLAIADRESDEALGYVGLLLRPSIESGIVGSTGDRSSDPDTISYRPPPLAAGIGYWVVEGARGRHVATRAVSLIGSWGLAHAGLARIEALVDPANIPSWRVVKRAGFRREGRLRSYLAVGGSRSDAEIYSLLPTDAIAGPPPSRS